MVVGLQDFPAWPLHLHRDLLTHGTAQVEQKVQGPVAELRLESTCPSETPGTRAVHNAWYVLHTVLACPGTLQWWPGRKTQSASRLGGIPTNLGHAVADRVRKGTFPQGQVFPKFT